MTAIQQFLHLHIFQVLSPALTAWLLTYLVHSTILILIAFLATRWLKPCWSPVADTLWKVAIVGALLTASIQVSAGIRPFGGNLQLSASETRTAPTWNQEDAQVVTTARAAHQAPATEEEQSQATFEVIQAHLPLPLLESPDGQDWRLVKFPSPVTSYRVIPDRRGMEEDDAPVTLGSTSQGGPPSGFLPATLLGLWLIGASLGLIRLAVLRSRFEDQLANRREITTGPLHVMLGTLRRAAGYHNPVRLTTSPMLNSPIALGGNEICLPEKALKALAPDEQRCVLAHELAHLVRRDPAWLRFCTVIEGLLFFQPLNRFARRRMQAVAEFLCDDFAAHHTGQGLTMARCLAEIASWVSPAAPRPIPVAGMAEKGSPLMQRVERLLDRGTPPPRLASARYRMALAGTLLALMVLTAPGITTGEGEKEKGQVFVTRDGRTVTVKTTAEAAGVPEERSLVFQDGRRLRLGVVYERSGEALASQLGVHPEHSMIVTKTFEDFPAAKAGIEKYDIITRVNGEEASGTNLTRALKDKKPGETVELHILRKGQPISVTVTLDEPKAPPPPQGMTWNFDRAPKAFFSAEGPDSIEWTQRIEEALRAVEMELPDAEQLRIYAIQGDQAEKAHQMAKELRVRLESASDRSAEEMRRLAEEIRLEVKSGQLHQGASMSQRLEELAQRMAELGEEYSELTLNILRPIEGNSEWTTSLADVQESLGGFQQRMQELEERLHTMAEQLDEQQIEIEVRLEQMHGEIEEEVEQARVAYAARLSAAIEKAIIGEEGLAALTDHVQRIALDVAEEVEFHQISINDTNGERLARLSTDKARLADLLIENVEEALDEIDLELRAQDLQSVKDRLVRIAGDHAQFETQLND